MFFLYGWVFSWFANPIVPLVLMLCAVGFLTFIAPVRTAISFRVWPMKMGRAQGREKWTDRNPDIMFGIYTMALLSFYLAFAVLGATRG